MISYAAVLVEHFDDDRRRRGTDAGDRSWDENGVEDEHLVPGGTQRLFDHLRALALVDEHDPRERVRKTRLVGPDEATRLVHVGTQLERLPFCRTTHTTKIVDFVLILLILDFNYIITCLMWATVSALLCLVCPVLLLFYSCVFPACFVEQINGYGYGLPCEK